MNKYIIESQSGIGSFRNCVLGTGATEEAAWEDAFGPKPWTSYVKKTAKKAWCREMTPEEIEESC